MRYSLSIDIPLPRDQVVALFDDTTLIDQWQPCLVSSELLKGEPGQEGTQTKLVQKMGKREVEMVETISKRALPDEFVQIFEAKGCWNEVINRFRDAGGSATRWEIETEFRCTGVMWVMCKLMPGMFKKETLKHMNDFKTFALARTSN